MLLLMTIDRIKNFEIPPIFKEGGRYAKSDVEIIEADFNQEELKNEIVNDFNTLKVNILMIHGRVWELACGHKVKKVYIFNVAIEDVETRIKIEDMKLDIMFEMDGAFNKRITELKPRIITMQDPDLVRG